MGREELKQVFEETKRLYTTDSVLKDSIKNSIKLQGVFLESESVTKFEDKNEKPVKIIVSQRKTLEAAEHYKGKLVCVHNFASARRAGGGVENGSTAQEECICRCSTLYPCLRSDEPYKKFYRPHNSNRDYLNNDDCIYTPDVTVFRKDDKKCSLLSKDEWYNVDVITCAAPNLRDNSLHVKMLRELHMKRLRRILDVAKAHGADVVILGAFGCGVFKNPTDIVASAYREVLKEYKYAFETIEFAVYCTPRDTSNYDTFKRYLGRQSC